MSIEARNAPRVTLVNEYVLQPSGNWEHLGSKATEGEACDTPGIEGGVGHLGPTTAGARLELDSASPEELPGEVKAKLVASTPDDPELKADGDHQYWRALKTEPIAAQARVPDPRCGLAVACRAQALRRLVQRNGLGARRGVQGAWQTNFGP